MSNALNIPILDEAALAALRISTDEVVACIEHAILSAAKGQTWSAPKAVITPPDGRYMMAALAASDDPAYLSVKTVVLNPDNPNHGLPQINGLVTMLDSHTGLPAAVIDGNWITAVRTAGLSATAARRLARPDAHSIGFVGAGVQASSHLDAFADLFPLGEALIFSRGQANIDRLAAHARQRGLEVTVCDGPDDVLTGADLVVTSVTATSPIEPFLDAARMKAGAFAAVTDLAVPWIRESFAALDRIIIDDVAQEQALPNKLCPLDAVSGDLAGLVTGAVDGRSAENQRTAFVFRGYALGDLALSCLAMERYRADNPG